MSARGIGPARSSSPTGATRLGGVIGDPIRHSLSPTLLNGAFEASGLDAVFLAFQVPAGEAAAALDAMRTLGLFGLSVTMPHKADVAAAVDECTPDAAALGAVNCVALEGDRLVGHNTDGAGFLDALRLDAGVDPAGRDCAVVGAGGAARAVVRALAQAGAARVAVVNRSEERAEAAAALAGPLGVVADAGVLHDVDLVVQATSVGMAGGGSASDLPFDVGLLRAGQTVVDIVYQPFETPLLAAARAKGVRATNGLGMLIHQAGHAYRIWTGEDPPVAAMAHAAEAALRAREHEGP